MDPTEALLNEGGKSYVPAVSAMLAFRELICTRCRQTVQNRLPDYAKALKLSLNENELGDCNYPSLKEWEHSWASIGTEIKKNGGGEVSLFHTLEWELIQDRWITFASASLWIPKSKQPHLNKLHKSFRMHATSSEVWSDNLDLGIRREIQALQFACFENILDSVLQDWIGIWKKVGGFPKNLLR